MKAMKFEGATQEAAEAKFSAWRATNPGVIEKSYSLHHFGAPAGHNTNKATRAGSFTIIFEYDDPRLTE